MNILGKIERIAAVAQNFAIIFGITGGLLSVLTNQLDKRVARTLELYKDYVGAVRKEALEIDLKWAQFATTQPNLFEKKIEEQKQLVNSFFENAEYQRSLLSILNFYDTLYICVVNRACDRNSAIELFGPTARSTFEISGHYITTMRRNNRSEAFGQGLEQMYRLSREKLIERYI